MTQGIKGNSSHPYNQGSRFVVLEDHIDMEKDLSRQVLRDFVRDKIGSRSRFTILNEGEDQNVESMELMKTKKSRMQSAVNGKSGEIWKDKEGVNATKVPTRVEEVCLQV